MSGFLVCFWKDYEIWCKCMYARGLLWKQCLLFIMLTHEVGGECWQNGSGSWTFPPFCCCATDGSRGAVTKQPLTWKCRSNKGVSLYTSMWNKLHLLKFIDLLNIYRALAVDVGMVMGWVVCFSSGDSGSPPLVQILTSAACRLLFITGKTCG